MAALAALALTAPALAVQVGPVADVVGDPTGEPGLMPRAALPGQGPLLLPDQGPDPQPVGPPAAKVVAFDGELWAWTGATRTRTVALPEVAWSQVWLVVHSWPNHPNGDPWDRLFMVSMQGTEVLHGTTPRGDFTIWEDVTEYASLLHGRDTVDVALSLSSWAGRGLFATVELWFFDSPQVRLGDAEEVVVSPFRWWGLNGAGPRTIQNTVTFPDAVPTRATIELFTSGHGAAGEFWWMNAPSPIPPRFDIYVDGSHVGTVHALPYVYALLGFSGTPVAEAINQYLWWTAFQALDWAGVHGGVGEIPAYRAELPAELLPLLTGDRTVEVVRANHGGNWPTSVNFLLHV